MLANNPELEPFPPESLDLRRRQEQIIAEELLDRARWLDPDDRRLVRLKFQEGLTASQIALARGEDARAVRRRLRKLTNRMNSAEFEAVRRNRSRWTPELRRVATACIMQGRTHRQAADHLHLSLHAVRRHMLRVRTIIEASS